MAVYQYKLELLPKSWVDNPNNTIESLFDNEGYDVSHAWDMIQRNEDILLLISNILPKGKSWHKELVVWGSELNNDIQLWVNENTIESISIRIDLREIDQELLNDAVELAKKLNCMFFAPEQKDIFEPDILQLKKHLFSSNASEFAEDPEGYLKGLKTSEENAT